MAAPKSHRWFDHLRQLTRDPLGLLDQCTPPHAKLWLGRPVWLLLEAEDTKHVLGTHASRYVKGQAFRYGKRLYGNSLLVSEGEEHRQQSRRVGELFFRHAASPFLESISEFTQQLTGSWQVGQRIDLWQAMSQLTLALSSRAIFGRDYLPTWLPSGTKQAEAILASYDIAMGHVAKQNFSAVPLPDWLPFPSVRRYRRAIDRLNQAVATSLHKQQTEGDRGGLIDHLSRALPANEVRDQALTLTLGGYESSTSALCWALLLLDQHATHHQQLCAEWNICVGEQPLQPSDSERLPKTRRFLSEVLRLYPPPWLIPRNCPDGDRLPSGLELPKGAMIFLSPYCVHRDPRYFENPLDFSPERWNTGSPDDGAYFPFGMGPRHCLGESVAWKQLTLLLACLGRNWRFVPDSFPSPCPLLTLRPPAPLWVRLARPPQSEEPEQKVNVLG